MSNQDGYNRPTYDDALKSIQESDHTKRHSRTDAAPGVSTDSLPNSEPTKPETCPDCQHVSRSKYGLCDKSVGQKKYHMCMCRNTSHAYVPTPVLEGDELARLIKNFEDGELGHPIATSGRRENLIRSIGALITKQNQAYHAAGLRELQQAWLTGYDGAMVYKEHFDQAIAKEESK
ncbi:hypothetical protein ACFWP5_08920 [Streptomyces sp. NPDC058469]|uniref:hypothetical protein n=1 Tax=Streptomyces sp. NPDC058469 TaxID=3346514 RepID=UPI00365B69E7